MSLRHRLHSFPHPRVITLEEREDAVAFTNYIGELSKVSLADLNSPIRRFSFNWRRRMTKWELAKMSGRVMWMGLTDIGATEVVLRREIRKTFEQPVKRLAWGNSKKVEPFGNICLEKPHPGLPVTYTYSTPLSKTETRIWKWLEEVNAQFRLSAHKHYAQLPIDPRYHRTL